MKRNDFLKGIGLTGLALVIPKPQSFSKDSHEKKGSGGCVLIPSEIAGPFPLDLTTNEYYFRQDIREEKPGAVIHLRMRVVGLDDCMPMQNIRINIWQCDKDGLYSGYNTTLNPGQTGLTFLRGYQITDANGEVEFTTLLPGWYPGRVCHLHFKVFVSSTYAVTSQFTFNHELKTGIYEANSEIYTDGIDPMEPEDDGTFIDGYAYQEATLVSNKDGSYDSFLEVTVQGSGTTGIGYLERRTAQQVELGQNYPNPFETQTMIPFLLKKASEVKIEIWSLSGKRIVSIDKGLIAPGEYQQEFNLQHYGLPLSNYAYQIEVKNDEGTFTDCKQMTALKK